MINWHTKPRHKQCWYLGAPSAQRVWPQPVVALLGRRLTQKCKHRCHADWRSWESEETLVGLWKRAAHGNNCSIPLKRNAILYTARFRWNLKCTAVVDAFRRLRSFSSIPATGTHIKQTHFIASRFPFSFFIGSWQTKSNYRQAREGWFLKSPRATSVWVMSSVRYYIPWAQTISCFNRNVFFRGRAEDELYQIHPSLLQPAGKRSGRLWEPTKSCCYKQLVFFFSLKS